MDIDAHLDAVDRGIRPAPRRSRTYVQTVTQTYPAPIDEVWDALTSADASPAGSCPSAATCASADATIRRQRGRHGQVVRPAAPSASPGNTAGRHLAHRRLADAGAGRTRSSSSTSPERRRRRRDVGAVRPLRDRHRLGPDPARARAAPHDRRGEAGRAGVGRRRGGHRLHARQRRPVGRRARRDGGRSEVARAAADTTFAAYMGGAGQMD